jgi:hypothetical protein
VVDRDRQFQQDLLSVGGNTMSRLRFMMRNYGMTEEAAKKELAEIDVERRANMDLFNTPVEDEA